MWGTQDLRIEFTTAQLNDVLKSLTLVDLNGGRISAVHYNSIAPLGAATADPPCGEEGGEFYAVGCQVNSFPDDF